MKKNKQPKDKIKIPRAAYAGFLFQTFFKRPFGYVIACLYVVYLAVILLIVPGVLKLNPLFIWNVGGFNMPVFNLFFIAASAAALAVSIFRTGREDGTELSLSSKPLTKGSMVGMKVLVYLVIMVVFSAIAIIITALTLPIFGEYNEITNIQGITMEKYIGLNLSVLIGNLINMLLFGGISVLLCMVGGQVITMVGSVGIVFIMCLMNFLYPQITTSSLEGLQNKYDAEMLSYSCNTLSQYHKQNSSNAKKFATIACITDSTGEEKTHFDTREYWLKAEKESGGKVTNYIDFARQLSSLFSSFGLDQSKLEEASKLAIGVNRGYSYHVDEQTHVTIKENIDAEEYPIGYYSMTTSQGFQYPQVLVIGGNLGINTNNWYAVSSLGQYDFNSTSILTLTSDGLVDINATLIPTYQRKFFKINELGGLNNDQKLAAVNLYDKFVAKMKIDEKAIFNKDYFTNNANDFIANDTSGAFFTGKFSELTGAEQHTVVSKIHMYWAIYAREQQLESIKQYCKNNKIDDAFPYSSKTVVKWYNDTARYSTYPYYYENVLNNWIYKVGIKVRVPKTETEEYIQAYDKLVVSSMNYAETYSNLYQYTVTNFYTIRGIIAVWSIVSVMFFTGSIIIYRKTDFK